MESQPIPKVCISPTAESCASRSVLVWSISCRDFALKRWAHVTKPFCLSRTTFSFTCSEHALECRRTSMMDLRRTHDAMLRDTPPKDSHTNHTCSSTPPAIYPSVIAWESAVQQHKPRVHDCMTACRRLRMLMMRVMTAPNDHDRKWRRAAATSICQAYPATICTVPTCDPTSRSPT